EGGTTDPYRRLAGCLCDSLRLSFPIAGGGDAGSLAFSLKAMTEATATAAIASSTYAAPTPGADPVSSIDIIVNDLFGITTPKLMSLDVTISNAMRDKYAFGSPNPFDIGLGGFDVTGQVQIYFTALAEYATFVNRQTGLALDLTIGSVEDQMDLIQLGNVDVWNPDVTDPGGAGDNMVTLNFMARYDAGDAAAIKWTRNYGLVP
ncbi:MAG TPA: phage tail tube protein, partial [Reyranella sp.]|nr:phage tail tube protein [Reyranella sp.]